MEKYNADIEMSKRQGEETGEGLGKEEPPKAVDGELLLILHVYPATAQMKPDIHVYVRPDRSIYCTFGTDGYKLDGAPVIGAKKASLTLAQYHPSQAVYTGVTVGGVTTGGVHYTKAGYSYEKENNGKGEVVVTVIGESFVVKSAEITEFTLKKFCRASGFSGIFKGREVLCEAETEKSEFYSDGVALAAKSGDIEMMMKAAAFAADERRLPYKKCVEIAALLGSIANAQYPLTAEELYQHADSFSSATDMKGLKIAIDSFLQIADYKDSKKRADELQVKYEELLQIEKEKEAVKEQAALRKRKKAFLVVGTPLNVLVTAFIAFWTYRTWTNEGSSVASAIIVSLATLLSLPGVGKLLFGKDYRLKKRALRWVIVAGLVIVSLVVLIAHGIAIAQ